MLPVFFVSATLSVWTFCHCWYLLLYLSGYVTIVVGICFSTCLDMLSLLFTSAPLPICTCCWCVEVCSSAYLCMLLLLLTSAPLPICTCFCCCWRLLLYLSGYVAIVVGVCFFTCLHMSSLLWRLLLYLSGYVVIVIGAWSFTCLNMLPLTVMSALLPAS